MSRIKRFFEKFTARIDADPKLRTVLRLYLAVPLVGLAGFLFMAAFIWWHGGDAAGGFSLVVALYLVLYLALLLVWSLLSFASALYVSNRWAKICTPVPIIYALTVPWFTFAASCGGSPGPVGACQSGGVLLLVLLVLFAVSGVLWTAAIGAGPIVWLFRVLRKVKASRQASLPGTTD